MMRTRMAWIRSNMPVSSDQALSEIPYCFKALGVDPPDWSSAAIKPLPAAICLVISAFDMALSFPMIRPPPHSREAGALQSGLR